jgi:hypothetical protein
VSAEKALRFADPREERRVLLDLVADGEHPIELRYRLGEREWRKLFADSPAEANEAASRLTGRADVYVGMLPRLGRDGEDQRRYAPARLLWVDSDTERSVRKLWLFDPTPTAIVRSGGVDGDTPKRHAYWLLAEPLPAEDVKRHALRLAHHFESDPAVADAGRVMRVPGSRSYKTGRVARLESFTGEAHALTDVTGALDDAPSYVADNQLPAAAMPGWLVELARGRRAETTAYGEEMIVPVGKRHAALVRFAGSLRAMGLGEAALLVCGEALLRYHCADPPERPIDYEKARRAIRSIAKYPPQPNRRAD